MRLRPNPVEALVTLPRVEDPEDRRASWRQVVAALGRGLRVDGPPPLDGIQIDDLIRGARAVVQYGLADDMDWIAPGSAAVALYELSAALPSGNERRELGRRAFARLYEGTAGTFAAVATRMALGNARPLETATMRARIGLVLDLPIGTDLNADPLAFALVARRELFQRWVATPSTGALRSRRLAARLLERAAREAVARFQQGDPYPVELLAGDEVSPILARLLSDREPLVWRHAAVARGLLSTVRESSQEEVELALDPGLTPTEWRRAAVSLTACLTGDTELAMRQCRALLSGTIGKADPGIAATMVWGLPCVVESEPEAAEELLDWLAGTLRFDVAESVTELLRDVASPAFGSGAAEIVREVFQAKLGASDGVTDAVIGQALSDLERGDDGDLVQSINRALVTYKLRGARAANELALTALERATASVGVLEEKAPRGGLQPAIYAHLAALDSALLERTRLVDLLLLGRRPGDKDTSIPEVEALFDRLGRWLLDGEEQAPSAGWSREASTSDQRRLKVLLHLVDLEATSGDDSSGAARGHARIQRAIRELTRRLTQGPDGRVHRILCAALSRSFDAAVRQGVAEPSDILLMVADRVTDRISVAAMAEASTHRDVSTPLAAWEKFLARATRQSMESIADGNLDPIAVARGEEQGDESKIARSVVSLSRRLAGDGAYRGEALRQVVLRIGRSLETIAAARGLSEIVDPSGGGGGALTDLELATDALRRLNAGALRRLLADGGSSTSIVIIADVPPLSALLERAVTAGVPPNGDQLAMAIGELTAEIPPPLTAAIAHVLARVRSLPTSPPGDSFAIPLQKRREALPDWLMPRRTIGGFYVVRALGAGGVSSVFVARRTEERHDAKAEVFALKVPEYDPNTARSLTEQEFMQLFREEAGALLSLPANPNLARFVSFDLASRPKPILVMELIRGFSLDRLIRSRSLTTERVMGYLDGILGGLDAMHAQGVGHLDVKPSNVILREGKEAVLVDFGLSGRQLRPGCGTLEYCSPEVLGIVPEGYHPPPAASDLYAFACTAFEMLTTTSLFEGEDETALASGHVSHDGWPEKLVQLAASPEFIDMATVFAACLRRDPRNRPSAQEARDALRSTAARVSAHPWPLVAPPSAATA